MDTETQRTNKTLEIIHEALLSEETSNSCKARRDGTDEIRPKIDETMPACNSKMVFGSNKIRQHSLDPRSVCR